MSDAQSVTVLIPARNEERHIERCLRAVLAQDFPHDRMEIVLVDGGSTDSTASAATEVLAHGDVRWKVVENPVGTTPSNLNAGLAVASGDVICRVDARSLVPPDYVRRCAEVLAQRPEVAVTGGAQVARASDLSLSSRGIARALGNRFAMGGSRYRSGGDSGPTDTVYLGAFRSQEIRAAGGWNESFSTNQDFELNRRMACIGLVWFDSRLQVGYLPRTSFRALWSQYHRFGRWKAYYWRSTGDPPRPRQAGLLAGVLVFLVTSAVFVGRGPARSRRVIGIASITAQGLMIIDHLGSQDDATPGERIASCLAAAITTGAWITGVFRGLTVDREAPPQ